MNIYDLSRNFWDFSFENPEKIKPNHIAMYFFAIEHCNRLGWKGKFGFPTSMVMEAIGIKSYNTFIGILNDLVSFGFISMIEKSKNQYSANIIALSNFDEALDKSLDKAMIKHTSKQSESTVQSTVQSIDSIDIPIYNITNTPINNVLLEKEPKGENITKEFPEENLSVEETNDAVIIEKKEKEKSSAKKEKDPEEEKVLVYHFETETFIAQWNLYKMYRKKKHNFSFMDIDSENRKLTELYNLVGGDEKLAIKTILNSIDNGYKGLFLPKNEKNGKPNNYSNNSINNKAGNSTGSSSSSGKVSARTLLARRISQNSTSDRESGNFTINVETIE